MSFRSIQEHPALQIIGLRNSSEIKQDNHRLWEARLPDISLKGCVEFIDADIDNNIKLSAIFRTAHSCWFDNSYKSKPWWRVTIINGIYSLFVYHHSIGGGLCGHTFQRSLLAALNSDVDLARSHSDANASSQEISPSKIPFPYPLGRSMTSYVASHLQFSLLVVRFLFHQKYLFFSDAVFSKAYPTVAKRLPVEKRIVMNVELPRIDQETMGKVS